MQLDVPLFLQNKNSRDCGPICLKMVLAYYGQDKSYADIAGSFQHVASGTTFPQLGSYMLAHGFDATIVTLNPHVFHYGMQGLTDQAAIRNHLVERRDIMKTDDRRTVAQHLIDFIDNGGTYQLKIPDKTDIATEIAEHRPVIALLSAMYLHGAAGFNFHFNVVTGVDADTIYVNDPLWNETGHGKYKLPADAYLYAMHAAAFGDLDNDSLLLIRPK